jgi:hypothetical protein
MIYQKNTNIPKIPPYLQLSENPPRIEMMSFGKVINKDGILVYWYDNRRGVNGLKKYAVKIYNKYFCIESIYGAGLGWRAKRAI